MCMCVCHGWCASRVLFYFLSAYQPLGLHRLSISDGAELAKLRSAGPGGTPVVRRGAVSPSLSGGDALMRRII